MPNYYEILKVQQDASGAEIKSAYRKLARKLHPDKNQGSEETARAFAAIAEAYEVLGNPKERAVYDTRLLQARYSNSSDSDSVFVSTNAHARRWRQMVYEHRYNEIIDRMIAEERRESFALQKVIFPIVALFMSCLVVTILRPKIFEDSPVIVKILLVSLFVAGVIHLFSRIRDGLQKYAYAEDEVHKSILDDEALRSKPVSKWTAGGFLVGGVIVSLGVGLLIGNYVALVPPSIPSMFSQTLKPEFIFYPPIIVMLVDIIHSFALRGEG